MLPHHYSTMEKITDTQNFEELKEATRLRTSPKEQALYSPLSNGTRIIEQVVNEEDMCTFHLENCWMPRQ